MFYPPFLMFFGMFPIFIIVFFTITLIRRVSRRTQIDRRNDTFEAFIRSRGPQDSERLVSPLGSPGNNSMETRIFRLAHKNKGVITVSDIVIETGLGIDQATDLIQSMTDERYIHMEVQDNGIVHYEFPEIIEHFKNS